MPWLTRPLSMHALVVVGQRGSPRDRAVGKALRLARYFGTTDHFWLNLQNRYDLEVEKLKLKGRLTREVLVLRRAG